MIFGFFGQFIVILGGSLNQVLVPAVCTEVFLTRRQWGSGQSLADVAVYVYDSRAIVLLGWDTWNHMLFSGRRGSE